MKIKIIFIIILFVFLSAPLSVLAEEPGCDCGEIEGIPPSLDPGCRNNKTHKFEFSPFGGSYLGERMGQTWMAGSRLYYFFNNTYGLGASYGYSRLYVGPGSPFGSILTDKNVQFFNTELQISNDAAFRVGKDILEMDFYLTAGVGAMLLNKDWEPFGLIGGGVKFFTGIPWLAFRIDVNNYAHYTPVPGGSDFDFDVAFLGGASFMFPTQKKTNFRRASK